MEEIWRDVIGYEGLYEVSNCGRLRTTRKIIGTGYREPIIMKQLTTFRGYKRVSLSKDCHYKIHFSHRLVAQAFIENPQDKPYINHKNGIKDDNNVANLEWVTSKENTKHAFDNDLIKTNNVIITDLLNGEISYFKTFKEASLFIGKAKNYLCLVHTESKTDTFILGHYVIELLTNQDEIDRAERGELFPKDLGFSFKYR